MACIANDIAIGIYSNFGGKATPEVEAFTGLLEKLAGKENYQKESVLPAVESDPVLGEVIKSSLAAMYPSIVVKQVDSVVDKYGATVLGKATRAGIEYARDASLDTLPHEYAHIYLDIVENITSVDKIIKDVMRKKKVRRDEAKELIAERLGLDYVLSKKKGYMPNDESLRMLINDTMVGKILKAIKLVFDKVLMHGDINNLYNLSNSFINGDLNGAISLDPKEGYALVDAKAVLENNKDALDIINTVKESTSSSALTGSVALAAQGPVYRKSNGETTNLHDIDIVVKSKELRHVLIKLREKYELSYVNYNDTLSDPLDKDLVDKEKRNFRIMSFWVVDKGNKVEKDVKEKDGVKTVSIRNVNESGETIGKTVQTIDVDKNTLISEVSEGTSPTLLDLMAVKSHINSESFEVGGSTIQVANYNSIFAAKRQIGETRKSREKDVIDEYLFRRDSEKELMDLDSYIEEYRNCKQ